MTDSDDERVTTLQTPEITLTKDAAYATGQTGLLGDTVNYSFAATNTGNVTLTGVTITDPKKGLTAIKLTWPAASGVLLPGESVTGTASYVVTQADVDATRIGNVATATGTPPSGTKVSDDDPADIATINNPAIELVKDAALAKDATGIAGDTVKYSFTVTNTGNVTLSGVGIADPMPGLSAVKFGQWPDAAGVLLPGESVSASASYVLKQADVDAGVVDNVATTTGTPKVGPPVSDDDPASIATLQKPSIELVKDGVFSGGAGGILGGTIDYEFTATNTGTVTLTAVSISDELDGLSDVVYGDWPVTAGTLAPGESVTATASLLLTQDHVNGGSITNKASVSGVPPTGAPVTDDDAVTLTIVPTPAIRLAKEGSMLASTTGIVGDGMLFTMIATNTGNVTLRNVEVTDPMHGLSALAYGAWPAADGVLEPGESVTVTARYVLTAADVARGSVSNTATNSGVGPDGENGAVGTTVTDESTAKVSLPKPVGTIGKTGIEALPLAAGGSLVLALGAGLLLLTRRRRRTAQS